MGEPKYMVNTTGRNYFMKIKLGLLYGGKSAEHRVSMQTALAVTKALDLTKFDVHPIYITERGEWIRGGGSLKRRLGM